MNADALIDLIARRLGRGRRDSPPSRTEIGVPDFHRAAATERAELLAKFARELEAVGGRFVSVPSREAVLPALRSILLERKARRVVTSSRSELAPFAVDELWTDPDCTAWPEEGGDPARMRELCATADAGVTPVDFAIAASGTLALTAAPRRPRSISLLPRAHIALVHGTQLVAQLGDAMEALLARPGAPASATLFVTGPSRTSDIENDLTIGVHGPEAVIVVLCEAT